MEFIETSIFAREADRLLTSEEHQELQNMLLDDPEAGVVIEQTGGLRKVRFAAGSKGKRGGARVIYYYHHRGPVIFLLLVYAKSRQDDLTAHQKKQLRALVQKEFK